MSRKKALLVPFRELLDSGKKFEITSGFILYGYSHFIEIGGEENLVLPLFAAAMVRILTCIGAAYAVKKRHCRSFKGDVACIYGKPCLKVSMRLIFLFNLGLLLLAGIKLILRNILEKKKNGQIG